MNIKFNSCEKFFGQSGYTSTSANFISNKAKEIIAGMNSGRITFLTTKVKSLNSNVDAVYENGYTEEQITDIIKQKNLEAKLNALEAWFREAIKAKDHMLSSVEYKTFESWFAETYPDVDNSTYGAELLPNPAPTVKMTDEEEWASENMSVKDLCEYLTLQQYCASLGSFVHPNGDYARARKEAHKKAGTSKIDDLKSNTVIYTYEPSVDDKFIETKFFETQELYRTYQKRLNAIKFDIENAVRKQNDEHNMQTQRFDEIMSENQVRVQAAKSKYKTEFKEWKIKKLDEIRHLKIIVPNELKDTVQFVNDVQKN